MNANSGNTAIEKKHSSSGNLSMTNNSDFVKTHSMRSNGSENNNSGNKVILPPLSQQIQIQQSSHILSQPLLKNGSNVSGYRYIPATSNSSPTTAEGQAFNFLLNKQNKNANIYSQQQLNISGVNGRAVPDDALEAAKLVVNFSNNQPPISSNGSGAANSGFLSVFQKPLHGMNSKISNASITPPIPMTLQQHGSLVNNISNAGGSSIGPILTPSENASSQQISPGMLNEQGMNYSNTINAMQENMENGIDEISRSNYLSGHTEAKNKVTKPRKRETCDVCNQSFSNLRTHMASHLDAKARPFKCAFCFRGFARNNDLQRHQKKHLLERNLNESTKGSVAASEQLMSFLNAKNSKKKNGNNVCATPLGFQCPFFLNNDDEIGYPDDEDYVPNRCHTTGVFTRCDTFKNHLKALHFRYPKGTSRKKRPSVEGYCKHCSVKFPNCKKWVDEHVLLGSCMKNKPFKSYMVTKSSQDREAKNGDENSNFGSNASSAGQGGLHVKQEEPLSQSLPSRPPTTASILDLNSL